MRRLRLIQISISVACSTLGCAADDDSPAAEGPSAASASSSESTGRGSSSDPSSASSATSGDASGGPSETTANDASSGDASLDSSGGVTDTGGAGASHEPDGMVQVGPGVNPMDTLPPQVPAADAWGQQYFGDQLGGNLEVIVDPTAPFSEGTYYRVHFPEGFGGGDAPSRWNLAGNFPEVGGPVRRLYCSFWVRYSDQYDTGSKLFFFSQEPPNNHYFILANGSGDEYEMVIQNQGYNFERVAAGFPELRSWSFVEFYIETGSPGGSDGVGRVWVDGELRMEHEAFAFFAADAAARWTNLWMDPTYGGPAGAGEFVDIGHVYTSVGA